MICSFLVSLCLVFTLPQSPRPREVKVTLADDAAVTGRLLKLDADALHVRSENGEIKLNLDRVLKIEFIGAVEPGKTEALSLAKAIRALAVAAPNLTATEYSKRLGDLKAAKAEVERAFKNKDGIAKLTFGLLAHEIAISSALKRLPLDTELLAQIARSMDEAERIIDP